MQARKLDKKKIALIHVAKAKVGMTEVEYRELLSSFSVSSSKDLAPGDFGEMMTHFEKLGFVSTFRGKPKPKESRKLLRSKIYAIRTAMNLPESYVDAMAQRMFGIDSYRWLDADRLHKLVAALTYHQRRQKK